MYFIQMRYWGPLDTFWMRESHQKDQGMIRGLELSAPSPNFWRGERRKCLELKPITNGQWFNQPCQRSKTSIITLKQWGLVSFSVDEHIEVQRGGVFRGHGSSMLLPLYVSLWISSIWLFKPCILQNKPIIVSKVFFWVLQVVLD